ncbi:hypothetical protein LOK49_LG04G00018 [Camellia lanceoleosa]|uniref:Uncharacterized protein n=1 Tax=Camellia lanceoleosa TaxID=1840588 RepID=A0ACC0I2P2_9ERIC|nr:hypothetical protein LOK49_LG04G00018 [Camellia lanceoleosa]
MSASDLVESELLKVPISEFANSVWSTIDVVQQVATLVSTFAEFANSVRSTIEVAQQEASPVSRFAEFANSVRLTIEVVQQVASLVSRFAGAFSDFRLSKAIADCLDLLDLSADKLTRTLSASQSPNGRPVVKGQGFIARDMTFENTKRREAPKLHSIGLDLSVLFRCAAARSKNTITAQGRKDPSESTGFSIQFSNISAHPDLLASLNSTYTYLGRLWKFYSRIFIMQSYMSNDIRQEGWLEWNENFALDTLLYGEFMNNGSGTGLGSRVKWPGFQPMNDSAQAYNFTVGQFILGNDWLPSIQNGNLAYF